MPESIQQPLPFRRRKQSHKIKKTCESCSKSYEVWPSQAASRYCSYECFHPNKSFIRACEWCGKEFKVKPYRAIAGESRRCSKACRDNVNPDGTRTCSKCGLAKSSNEFELSKVSRRVCITCRQPTPAQSQKYNERQKAKRIENRGGFNQRRRKQRAAWNEQQKERERERDRVYAARNAEKMAAYQKAYAEQNAERIRERKRKYRAEHKMEIRLRNIKRRARQKSIGGSFTASQWRELCAKYGNICLACREVKKLTADHIVPIAKGGSNDIANIQPLCLPCNVKKRVEVIDYRW